ncbi:hypothetical protein [Chelativorans salis]|uniref:Uncharacterized protein n=1 Tax=Chelativorans salis TaxID=2978478 RepID=A0ABT2LKJ8_9HYPH|nr:hypothetical protein [Chelativorans sp. EGI FJ00035]MCT7374203.1 hypothetical protein [Chelativorans sp. EGI FJ00035]
MMNTTRAIFAGTAASLLVLAGPAGAQQQGQNLTEDQVRSFFDSMEQETMQAVQAGDFQRLIGWTQNNIADEATFSVTNEIYRGDDRKGFSAMTLGKGDVLGISRAAVGMMSGMNNGQPVQDYSLQVEVTDFKPAGPDAATVTTEITESGTLSMPPAHTAAASQPDDETLQTGSTQADTQQQGSGQTSAQGEAQSLQFEATAQCSHLIHRGETGDQLVMGLSTCQARTNL